MTKDGTPTPPSPPSDTQPSDTAATRHAKGAARETIGKLIGDDAAVRKGRDEQRRARADDDAAPGDTPQQEQE